ncbi:MAG: hypothetical protein ABIJ09_20120 [Pseudomonadota bacterium]
MRLSRLGCILLLGGILVAGACDCGGVTATGVDASTVSRFDAARSDALAVDGQVPEGGSTDRRVDTPDPNRSDNATRDSDCDGLSDAEEFGNIYAGGAQTDPANPDSDGDGLDDGTELGRQSSVDSRCTGFGGDSDPGSMTDPTRADSDGDGLADGVEDVNHDGAYQAGQELDPRDPDTDDDGLCDGPNSVLPLCTGGDPDPYLADNDTDRDGVPDSVDTAPNNPDRDGDGLCDGPRTVAGVCEGGEDLNGNGVINAGESDPDAVDTDCDGLTDLEERQAGLNPRKRDTDGDLIPDGIERGVTQNPDPTRCTSFVADADPTTTTSASNVDSDGDGINDGIEDANRNGLVDAGETDPNDPDSDGDGACDGPPRAVPGVCTGGEDLNANGRVDPGESDPRVAGSAAADADSDGIPDDVENNVACLDSHNADSDGDGVSDGTEDVNHNGRRDPGETDACAIDSDCDGLVDGQSYGTYLGEATLGTSPTNADSDADGLTDGLEAGVAGNAVPTGTDASCGFVADADPATTSSPTTADSDGDGVPDGAEDMNQNGRVDTGELDPNTQDATGPVLAACSQSSLVPLEFGSAVEPDLLFATANYGGGDQFSERSTVLVNNAPAGLMFYNPTHQVAAFTLTLVPGNNDATASAAEQARRATLGNLSAPFTRTFTTWDGFAQSVLASYDDGASGSVKQRMNDIVTRLLNATPTGLLGPGGDAGPFKLFLEYVRRTDQRLVITGALIPAARYTGQSIFRAEDLGNGSALAQFGDGVGTQCDVFDVQQSAVVDFLWVIDNSGSMEEEQQVVANTATEMTTQLGGSTLNWRLGVITTDLEIYPVANWTPYVWQSGTSYPHNGCSYPTGYWEPNGQPVYCRFSTDPAAFSSCVTSLYVCGMGYETAFGPFACVMGGQVAGQYWCADDQNLGLQPPTAYKMLPKAANDPTKLRTNAQLAVVIMSDEPERSETIGYPSTTVQQWVNYFSNYDGQGSSAFVAGILCPPGQNCACAGSGLCETSDNRYRSFVQAMNGVEGDISDFNTIPGTITNIINAVAGSASPYALSKPPISSTIRVATSAATAGTCDQNNIPRSRQHGWDYDGATGNIVFFGNCRPQPASGASIAVSYRYWVDRTPDPGGQTQSCNCTPPEVCDPTTLQCYCPPDCGVPNIPPEQVCDTATCQLACRPDCGAGCLGNSVCNPAPGTCACECPSDCGGPSPGGNFVCDRSPSSPSYCDYVCSQCPGTPPNPAMACNTTSCEWQCPACGNCPGLATCNSTTCACECSQSMTCSTGYRWDTTACSCVCDVSGLGCGERYYADPTFCACLCLPNCGDTCPGNMYCNTSLCQCLPTGG